MAVYKSTRCYPFMNNIDIRVALANASSTYPVQFLTCKVDTSNKNITGYSIRVLDEDNNQVFPFSKTDQIKISPIQELQIGNMSKYYENNGLNSGINGTYLKIPFFQNYEKKMVDSYNAIYYRPKYKVDYIITNLDLPDDYPDDSLRFATPSNWTLTSENNWVFNSWNDLEEEHKNKIYLDGELLLQGQTVFVANTNSANGVQTGLYKVIKSIDSMGRTELQQIGSDDWINDPSSQYQVVILKGTTMHDKVLLKINNTHFNYVTNNFLWTDFDGENELKIMCGETSYKWEITLYQGEGEISTTLPSTISYDNIDNKYLDMVVTSGTILGSNSERVQIADIAPFGVFSVKPQLPALKNGTLVLQSKYMSFSSSTNPNDNTASFSSERYYVQTYDSTYGHVYPIEGNLPASTVESAGTIRFYKYSLNPEDILTTDIVEYGCDKELSFVLCEVTQNDDSYIGQVIDDENYFMTQVLINSRLYGIKRSDLENVAPIINSLIEGDQKILITNNTKPYMNGVYTVYERNDITYPSQPSDFDVVYLKRSASFNTWGSFLGKVVYVPTFYKEDGSVVSMNVESLAGSNPDYNLWNPDENESGNSNLYFSEERPILLFGNKIESDNYIDLITIDSSFYNGVNEGDLVDGIVAKSGMRVVYCRKINNSSPKKLVLCEITAGGHTDIKTLDYQFGDFYVSQGQKYGKLAVFAEVFDGTVGINTQLYTAVVLKNTSNYTFISPSLDTKPGMKLKLKGNNYITLDGENSLTQWLGIKDYDNKIYCIKHEELLTPTKLVSETSEEDNTPWRYEIRSFFKSSDFNPFYCYEDPYLILYKDNKEYSSLINITEECIVDDISWDESNEENVLAGRYEDSNTCFAKLLKLSAKYVQANGLSWEYYRWVLTDEKGNILQDTGKKYDKNMSVLFYGLTNDDLLKPSIYYATLYVEDDVKNLCVYTIRLAVKAGDSVSSGIPFTAKYECGANAVKLQYEGQSQLIPSYRKMNGTEDILYVQSSPDFDGGISYFIDNDGGHMQIKNKEGVHGRSIDYQKGSTITGDDRIIDSELSQSNKYGVPYYRSFTSTDPTQEINNERFLKIEGQTDQNDDSGELYFETQVLLDSNHCGQIIEWMVEGTLYENKNIEDPCYFENGSSNNLNGYLVFRLKTNDIFTISNPTSENYLDYLNPDRNLMTLEVFSNEEVNIVSHVIENISTFDKNQEHIEYYIGQNNVFPGNYNIDLVKNDTGEKIDFYIKKEKDFPYYFGVDEVHYDIDLGNLCLQTQTTQSSPFTYWVENRPFLIANDDAVTDGNYPFTLCPSKSQFTKGNRLTNADSQRGVLKWPGEDENYNEQDYIWSENANNEINGPLYWDDVSHETTNVVNVVFAAPRRGTGSGMNNTITLLCKINNISDIYNAILNNALMIQEELIAAGKITLLLKVNNEIKGEIKISKE